ncbi:hypothetical protein NUW54_g1960 [Trametes sanguinea]|uniref:Uncharacterized protein n=1 Tax=Trametes sanguinea TaxID=158606 RepID=A0ACC1Q787_9APHY|nr:hypothetical protein NUW54_g1960 [Trametes sanguinea]
MRKVVHRRARLGFDPVGTDQYVRLCRRAVREVQGVHGRSGSLAFSLESFVLISSDDEDDGDGYDHQERQFVRFVWVRDGTVDYASLPRRSAMRLPAVEADGEWEVVGTLSVDSGLICLFSKYALEALLSTGPDSSKQAMLEGLVDDFGGTNVFVPGGIVGALTFQSLEMMGPFQLRDVEMQVLL